MPGGWGDAGKGALTGASIGSFIPGIGTGIGAGVGALGGWLFGGKDDKDKTSPENPEDPYRQLLTDSASNLRKTGGDLVASGGQGVERVMQYLQSILGGNPAALMDATRVDTGRVMDQYDTARRAATTFGPRGGGTNSTIGESYFKQAEDVANIGSEARQNALSTAASLGTTMTGLGLSAEQLASQDLNTVINSVLTREGFDVSKRGQNMEALGSLGEALGTIIGAKMGGGNK